MERSQPQNLEAERALLGSILLDNSALDPALEKLVKEDFFAEAHSLIYEKMLALFDKTRTIDLVTLSEELGNDGLLEKVGGATYLASLVDGVPFGTTANVAEYCRIVKDKAIVRQLINASNNVITRCLEGSEDPVALIDLAQSQMIDIAADKVQSGFHRVREIVDKSFGSLDVLFDRGKSVTGVETGFKDLDDMTSGLQPGELIIIAARPSLGKTALALNIAAHAALEGRVVGVFSLEMSKESLLIRLLCSEARINSHRLRTGLADHDDWQKMSRALGRLAEAALYIDDTPSLNIMQIRAKARRLQAERKRLDLLIVDYLQLITGHTRFENRTQEVSYISRSLKGIAKELNAPVLALSQLSRAPEAGKGREPQLSDLRDSGSIEQDADVVVFIHRSAPSGDGTGFEEQGVITELNVGKQRNGPTGPIKLVFLKPYTRFENMAHEGEGPA